MRSNAPPAPAGDALIEKVAAEHVKGVDADSTFVVTRNLTLNGNVEFLDERYDQYPGTTRTRPGTRIVNGMLVGTVIATPANLAGLPVYNTPPAAPGDVGLGAGARPRPASRSCGR